MLGSETLAEIYKDFGQMTTMHGIKRTAHSHTTWLKVFWTVLVFSGTAWATYQIVLTIQSYYSFPSSTQVAIETSHTLELPAVTICNLNRLRLSKLGFLASEFEIWRKKNLTVDEQVQQLLMRIEDYPTEEKQSLGHSLNDMMLRCSFDSSESYLLPAPYGNCISQSSDTNRIKNLYEELGYTYTKDACMRTCLQKEIFKSCGCIESDVVNIINVLNYKDWLDLDQTKSIEICDELSERCIYRTVLQFQKGQLGCDELCPPACEQLVYHTTVSNSLWPSSAYIDNYIHFVNQTPTIKNKAYNWTAYPQAHVRNNFLRLEIYYETLNFEVSTSSPTFDWNSLLGNIGGQLGLWLGFSVLTAVEIVQLTMQVCVHVIHLQYDKYRKAQTCRDIEIALPPGSTLV